MGGWSRNIRESQQALEVEAGGRTWRRAGEVPTPATAASGGEGGEVA